MGRRGISVDEKDRWVFNRLAAAYRARPAYPPALVERLRALATEGPGDGRVVDLGAGTGQLAIPLSASGLTVDAVEPAQAMLDVLRANAPPGAPVNPVHAAAEDTALPSAGYSLAVLADALQWVDPELTGHELSRLVQPGGVVAVVEPKMRDTPFHRDLEALFAQANPKARRRPSKGLAQLFELSCHAAPVHVEHFSQEELLDESRLGEVVRSLSFVGPALSAEALEELVTAAREVARVHGGARWSRDITLTWSNRPAGLAGGKAVGEDT